MPRKKASEVPAAGASVAKIVCPACKSEVSGDGSTLHVMSKYLEELIETDADVPKLEKELEVMEEKYHAARLEAAKAKAVEPKTKPEAAKNETVGPEQGKQRRNWW